MTALLAFLGTVVETIGWTRIADFALFLMDAAKDLAQKDGLTPEQFDEKVRQLEVTRGKSIGGLIAKWKAMLPGS